MSHLSDCFVDFAFLCLHQAEYLFVLLQLLALDWEASAFLKLEHPAHRESRIRLNNRLFLAAVHFDERLLQAVYRVRFQRLLRVVQLEKVVEELEFVALEENNLMDVGFSRCGLK